MPPQGTTKQDNPMLNTNQSRPLADIVPECLQNPGITVIQKAG